MTTSQGTKADMAYRALRRAIVVGEIRANERLDEAQLMTRYAIGRTPTREALKRLAMEQFVVWPPRNAPFVRGLGLHELHRLYESRLLLEVPAARLAADRVSLGQLSDIDDICAQLDEAAVAGDVYEAIEFDHSLHMAITRGADNRLLAEAVGNLNCGSLRLWYVAHQQLGLAQVSADHRRIVDALHDRDAEAAARAAREHILLSHAKQIHLNSLSDTTSLLPSDTTSLLSVG